MEKTVENFISVLRSEFIKSRENKIKSKELWKTLKTGYEKNSKKMKKVWYLMIFDRF